MGIYSAFKHAIGAELTYRAVLLADLYVRVKRWRTRRAVNRQAAQGATNPSIQAYCDFSRTAYGNADHPSDRDGVILMDCFPVPIWVAANSILANRLAARHQARLVSFSETGRDALCDAFYRGFNCNDHILVTVPSGLKAERRRLFKQALASVKTKVDLFNLTIDGVQIGDEIYETYLRQFSRPTADIKGIKCLYVLLTALNYYLFFSNFFAKNRVAAAVLSHDIYVSMGILAKIAWKNGVPVYLANGHEMKKTTRPDEKYAEFSRYRKYFASLSASEQQAGIAWGKAQLEKRLGGQVGVNMAYSTKSAYTAERIERQTEPSDRIKIVIATHCFFDNPRAYGGMLFIDFHEWISFLGEISEQTDYDWYIKTHRDFLPGTVEAVRHLTTLYPKLKLINPTTTWHQLKDEGVSVALTCYGSVGQELPMLGYKVINAGYNPHVAYDFNWHPKSVEEYRKMLMNLGGLGEIRNIEDMYEFYFVHYNLSKVGGFLFDSFEAMQSYVTKNVHSTEILDKVVAGGQKSIQDAEDVVDRFLDYGGFSEAEAALNFTDNTSAAPLPYQPVGCSR